MSLNIPGSLEIPIIRNGENSDEPLLETEISLLCDFLNKESSFYNDNYEFVLSTIEDEDGRLLLKKFGISENEIDKFVSEYQTYFAGEIVSKISNSLENYDTNITSKEGLDLLKISFTFLHYLARKRQQYLQEDIDDMLKSENYSPDKYRSLKNSLAEVENVMEITNKVGVDIQKNLFNTDKKHTV